MASAHVLLKKGFTSPHLQAVIVGTMGEGRSQGNVTRKLFASASLRGSAGSGASPGVVEGAPARPWTPARGAWAPGVLLSGGSVSSLTIGRPWTSSLFLFSPAQRSLVLHLKKIK